jgi:predicted amidohydrolase
MRVAAVQLRASKDKGRNIANALKLVRRAAHNGAAFVALPEVFNYRGPLKTKTFLSSVAEPVPGGSVVPFLSVAREHGIFVLLGSLYERVPGEKRVYNTSVLIDDKGRVRAVYRKIHLFDAYIGKKILKESDVFKPGRKGVLADIGGFRAGLSICYDLRFPDFYRAYGKKGATLLMVPSAFTHKTGQAHWKALLRARAIENLCYVVAPNQIGEDARKVRSYGHSMIIGPWGEVLAEASGEREQIIYADLEMSELRRVRKILPAVLC